MRCMVGGYDIQFIGCGRCQQSPLVGTSLDGGIPLDAVSERGIIVVVEPKVMYADFAGDALPDKRTVVEESQFASCRKVEEVKSCIVSRSQFNGSCRRPETGFRAAYHGMKENRQVVAEFSGITDSIGLNCLFLFAMGGNQDRSFGKDTL